jgi:hypothetical protein
VPDIYPIDLNNLSGLSNEYAKVTAKNVTLNLENAQNWINEE